MWYYLDGVANILLHNKLITDSNQSIDHSSYKFEKSGDVRYLSMDCVISEGVEASFFPTAAGLHDCLPYFKEGTHMYIFGKKVTNNGVQGGDA